MEAGEIVRVDIPQADGKVKVRPALLLKQMRPFNDWLVCGISSSLGLEVKGFDLVVDETDRSFKSTGLKRSSLVRLGFLSTRPKEHITGVIGRLDKTSFRLLINRLSTYIKS